MNQNTLKMSTALTHCQAARDMILAKNGTYKSGGVRKVPGIETVELDRVWTAMHGGDDRAESALEVFSHAGNRLLIANLCCTIPEMAFVEHVTNELSTECHISKSVANLIATELKLHDRRFNGVEASLRSLVCDVDYEVCGVRVDDDFSSCLLTALESSVHINRNEIPPSKGPEYLNIIDKCFVGLEDREGTDAIVEAAFKSLLKIDSSITSRSMTAASVYNHAYRLAHRLWYDTGELSEEIAPSLSMIVARVAHSMANYRRFAPVVGLHLDTIAGVVDLCLNGAAYLPDEIEHASLHAHNSVERLCRAAKDIGADMGIMLTLDRYDNIDLHVNMRHLPDMINCFENGSIEVLDSGVVVRNPVNKFGGKIRTANVDMGNGQSATVAKPPVVDTGQKSLFDSLVD